MKHARPIAAPAGVALLAGVWLVLRSSAGEPPAAPDPVRPTPVARSSGSGPAPSTGPSDSEPVAVAELGAPADADAPARKCSLASGQEPDCEFLAPDQDTLLDMARCGVARLDVPHSPPPGSGLDMFPAPWRELAGVGEAEHAELEAAACAYLAAQRARLSELAVSVGIQREWSDATVPAVVVTRITAEFEPEQVAAAIDRVARERAGLEPDDGLELPPTLEQVIRLRLDTGDAFEAAIAEAVGEARAAELRAAADGWPGGRSYLGNHCPRPPIPTPERRVVPRTAAEAEACVDDLQGQGCSFADPNQLELDRMADCGMVRINIPQFLHDRTAEPSFGPAWAEEVGLTLDEEAALAEVAEEYRETLYAELTELLLAAGKSQAWIDQTSLMGLVAGLYEAAPWTSAEEQAMVRQIAEEKAGRIPPPADRSALPLAERMLRLNVELGDAFEDAVAARLGPERADELRRAHDGWPGPRIQTDNHCDGSEAQLL